MGGVTAAYDDGGKSGTPDAAIRITAVDKGSGPAYIVTIPGTSEWNVRSGSNPMDTVGNLSSASGTMSTASEAVELAMQQAGIPSDAPVMRVGHSQGGMTAANLAADAEFRGHFNVTNVLTYGSPIDSTRIPGGVKTLALQHPFDVVPRLDLGNSKPGGPGLVGWESSNGATVITFRARLAPGWATLRAITTTTPTLPQSRPTNRLVPSRPTGTTREPKRSSRRTPARSRRQHPASAEKNRVGTCERFSPY